MNNIFLKQLIESDFLFSKSNKSRHNFKSSNSSIGFKEKKTFNILNIFKLNASLKHYIRTLKFLKKKRTFFIYIICTDSYYFSLTEILIKKLSLESFVLVSDIYPEIDSHKELTRFIFLLGNVKLSKNFYPKLSEDKIFLITKYNLMVEEKLYGIYKIQNELDDYKKLVLLLVIMNKVLKIK